MGYDFRGQRREILQRLDIIAELRSLGVRLAASSPDSSGWIKCHAINREDATASAAVNVHAEGPERGYYRDHGGDGRMSFFDLAAATGKFPDWRAAYQHYASVAGVEVPSGNRAGGAPGTPVAEYVYHDQHGNPLSKLVKFDKGGRKKTFLQFGLFAGEWKPTTQGLQLVPYRLPELLATQKPGPVWIPEGEKDVERLRALGLTATCNVGGAGKFTAELVSYFGGYDVILLADNDEAGEKHVMQAAKHLHGIAASVRIVRFPELPPKGDVSDFLDAGGTLGELRRRAAEAEDWQPTSEPRILSDSEGNPEPGGPTEADHFTDIRNAELFIDQHGENVRFCFPWKTWLIWDGTRWRPDGCNQIYRLAKSVFEHWAAQVPLLAGSDLSKQTMRHAERSASARGIEAFLKLAAAYRPISTEELNRNPWLLNCPNGTIDLRTGQLREHRREDFITTICPTAFNPEAGSMVWDAFLESTFADHGDVIPFLQRLLGSALVGAQQEHILPIFHGSGANGKSVLLKSVIDTLGPDYAMQAVPDMLTDSGAEKHPTERADLFGKRLVAAIETEQNRRLRESMVKSLTGGDRIRARRLYQDFFEFDPTHLIVLCTNHKPKVIGDDHGIWRRLRLVPFEQTFEGDRCDKKLPDKLAAEREGILCWMVRGCLDWQAQGLNEPQTVLQATAGYRNESDIIGQFVADCCYANDGMQVKFADLYDAMEVWCRESGESLPSKTRIGKVLNERFDQVPNVRGRWYRGIELKDV